MHRYRFHNYNAWYLWLPQILGVFLLYVLLFERALLFQFIRELLSLIR